MPGKRFRRRVVWFGTALIVLIVGADFYEGVQDRRVAIAGSQQTMGLLSRAFADQTARIVQELDFTLTDFSEWYARADDTIASPEVTRARLLSNIARLPYVHSAAVFNADGVRRTSTEANPPSGVNIARYPIFAVPERSPVDELYVGTPHVGRSDGYRTFAVSRRLHTVDGRFAGVVVVRVAFERLAQFYAPVDVSPGARIRLLRSDGVDLAHYPASDSAAAAGDQPVAAAPAPAATGRRVVATQTVAGYPLLVEVAQPLTRALGPWRQQELASAARMGTLALLSALLIWALVSAVRRRELAEANQRATEARLQDARKAEALSLLAASVAHDFNNVLSAIVGYGELARADLPPGSTARGKLERLLQAAERARQLVRRVLTFDPKRSLAYEHVALGPVVNEVLDQLQTTLPKGVRVETQIPDEPLTLNGDTTEIHQVIMNLCTNAVHAMPNGGTLRLQLEPVSVAAAQPCAVGNLEPGEWLRLSVVDQGVGIAPELLEHIFDPLQTSKPSGQGGGIGLTVVRNVIAAMHGAVTVRSAPGAGSTFSAYWRRQRAADPARSRPQHAARSGPGAGQTVLIVDDEPQLVSLVEELTAGQGYESVGYSDPLRALEALRADPGRFDAVITDERMPGLRGIAFASKVHELRPGMPVILMTGYRVAGLDLEARESGVLHILDKPLRAQELARALAAVFGGTPRRTAGAAAMESGRAVG